MLSAQELVDSRVKSITSVPLFSKKEYEPNGSVEQSNQIQNCLSEIEKIISTERIKILGTLSKAVWIPELGLAEILHKTGSHWNKIGHTINNKLYVYPEEALYLLEIGVLEITFNEVPMSVQKAYFVLSASSNSIPNEKYQVYSHLKNTGFIVVRHLSHIEGQKKKTKLKKLDGSQKYSNSNIKRLKICSNLCVENDEKIISNDTKFVIENNEEDTNEAYHCGKISKSITNSHQPELNFDFDVFLHCSKKQKSKESCFQTPNYRIIIHSGDDPMPDFSKITDLSNKLKDNVSVINAIVFPDYIAFYSINPVILPNASEL